MKNNLDELKDEIREELAGEEFAVFRGRPGSFENTPVVYWDTEHYPDYRSFLNTAKKAGVRLMFFAHREFRAEELEDAAGQLADVPLPREERRELEEQLGDLRCHAGETCALELAFNQLGHLYVYQILADWYETFLDVADTIEASFEEEEEEPPISGYFSKN